MKGKHPRDMGPREVNEFLTWLAVHRNVAAAQEAGIGKRAGCHTFRHTFATELLKRGTDIRSASGQ
ncbi:hypothetical protein KEHDKFFH_06055 [Marinobacter maroccanus]|uniref:Integrase SAM-like N-terminal domain-containing protein n=1 Tax=Marinobacter maroccanus TaxID=2055143 RepID=A0A2S5ZDP1_9GAMM|nr:phage integrase N-terminal SAM-like domain-containing protein [Marinobacter maroccanus]PPI85312.1 hypothetical protein KEHDKFFH_06055 [Marinobacter maroccanus]